MLGGQKQENSMTIISYIIVSVFKTDLVLKCFSSYIFYIPIKKNNSGS